MYIEYGLQINIGMFVLVCGLDALVPMSVKNVVFICKHFPYHTSLFKSTCTVTRKLNNGKNTFYLTFVLNNFLTIRRHVLAIKFRDNLMPFRAETRGGQVTLSDNVT